MSRPRRVYVASSWRNPIQVAVVVAIRAAGIGAYDFKNPDGGTGFRWSEVGVDSNGETIAAYLKGLQEPRSIAGFTSDFDAMKDCDACVLVLPCGRSAHIEAGWMIGQGKPTAILLDDEPITPELMYLMADYIAPSLFDLLGWLGVED